MTEKELDSIKIINLKEPEEEKEDTYVYIIQAANHAIKIGVAKDVKKRLVSIQTANHQNIELLGQMKFDYRSEAIELERYAHHVFRDSVIKGEWFKPTNHLMSFVKYFVEGNLNGFCFNHQDIDEKTYSLIEILNDYAINDYKNKNFDRIRFLRDEIIDLVQQMSRMLPETKITINP